MNEVQWHIRDNGSYDIISPEIKLSNCYPAIDGKAIHPVSVLSSTNPETSEILYNLSEGTVKLVFTGTETGLAVRTLLSSFKTAPHSIQPLAGGVVSDADSIFRQGFGMGGPSRFEKLSAIKESIESFTVSAICSGEDAILTLSAHDLKRFIQRTLFYTDHTVMNSTATIVDSGFVTESIPLDNQELTLPQLHIDFERNINKALADCAEKIGTTMKARAPQPQPYHWCSWYYLYHNLTEDILDEYLENFSRIRAEIPMQTIQIDAGYFPSPGDWLELTPYWPSGLEAAFNKIKQAGFRAGIWIGPYMVGNQSTLYAEHPDWVLHDHAGKPVAMWKHYNEPKPWGYRDEETYVLDISHPDAMEYMRTVFSTFHRWGAELFKTDFMLWGIQSSDNVVRHTPGKTSVEYFRDLLDVVRKEIGEESYWLACIAPFAPFLGYADGMRIAGDVGASWDGAFGPANMIQESQGDQYFNNIWWHNDPDAILLRDFFISLNDNEIESLALWQAILGGVVCTSAPLHEIAPKRLALWKFLQPDRSAQPAALPFHGKDRKLAIATRRYEDLKAWALIAFNHSDETVTELISVKEAVGIENAYVYTWGLNFSERLGYKDALAPEIEAHSAILYYLSEDDVPPDPNLTLGGVTAKCPRIPASR